MPIKQVKTWRAASPQETTDFLVKEVVRSLRESGALDGIGQHKTPSYSELMEKIRPAIATRVAELKGDLEKFIREEVEKHGQGSGSGTGVSEARVKAAEDKADAAQTDAAQAKTDAAQAKIDAASAANTAGQFESRIAALESRPSPGGNQPSQPAALKGITLAEAEAALNVLNAAYPAVSPKISAYNSTALRRATAPSEAAKKAFVDAANAARVQGGDKTQIRLPENALVDLLAALNAKNAGRHNTAAGIATVCLNDYLPIEMQVDVLLPRPKMNHSVAVFDALEAIGEKDVTITAIGQFRMSKLRGTLPEIFGSDGDFSHRKRPEVKRYGAQPTMILRPDNVNYEFSRAAFIVDNMFQVGFEVCGYSGINTAHLGSWFTQRILDLDPDNMADDDWAGTLSPADLSKHFVPPSDKMTGAGAKGRVALSTMADGSGQKWVYEGFNTTMNNAVGNPSDWSRHIELSNARSNMVDTSSFRSGGYKPEYAYATWQAGDAAPSAFPQEDGTTAETWGTWGGGWIGNWGSGGMIYQHPRVAKSKREKARFIVLSGYFRGFRSYGIEVGLLSDPAGNSLPRHAFNYVQMRYDPAKAEQIYQYVPYNVWLKNVTVEDCYEGGIGANRYVNLVEEDSFVRRTGLPGWSMNHYRIETVQSTGKPAAAQVDPGYGSSSSRSSPQIGRRIIGGVYKQCARKGIDGHQGTETKIENVTIDSGIWGIQWVFDEPQSDIREASTLMNHVNTLIIRGAVVRSSVNGISLHNGSFGWKTHKTANAKRGNFAAQTQLWGLRTDAKVSDCVVVSELPFIDNYARSSTFTNCTAIRGHGFGGANPHSNKSVSCPFYIGSGNVARNGVSPNIVIRDCKAYNSPQGNFGAIARIGAVAVFRMDGLFADMTAYKKASVVATGGLTEEDALMLPYVGKDPALAGFSATALTYQMNAATVADKNKFVYDVTSCYKYDASSETITPLTLS